MDSIIQCCKRNWNQKLKKLLKPSHVLYVDNNGSTLHMFCAQYGSTDCLSYLLKFKESKRMIEKRNRFGFKAIDYAILNKDYGMFLVLRRAYGVVVDAKTKNILKNVKDVSLLYMLNNKNTLKREIFNKKTLKGRITEENKEHVNAIEEQFKRFRRVDFQGIGIASMIVSHYILNITKNYIDDGVNIVSEPLKKRLREIKKMSVKELSNTMDKKLRWYMKRPHLIDSFQKSVQWPHIPLAYVKENKGSCVDLAILKYLTLKKQGEKITLALWKGSNTYISHVEVQKSNKFDVQNLDLLFCLFSLYHVFRHLQYIRYMVKNKSVENKLINFVLVVLNKIIQQKEPRIKLRKFILKRTQETYDQCINIIKEFKLKSANSPPVIGLLKNNPKNVQVLEQYFENVVVNPNSVMIKFKGIGYGIYRIEDKYFLARYNVKVPNKYIYIAYLLRTNPNFTGVTQKVMEVIKKKHKLPILTEVRKRNTVAFSIYLKLGYKHIGSYGHQHLMQYGK